MTSGNGPFKQAASAGVSAHPALLMVRSCKSVGHGSPTRGPTNCTKRPAATF